MKIKKKTSPIPIHSEVTLFIPTYRRQDLMTTHLYVSSEYRKNTYLVVRSEEYSSYSKELSILDGDSFKTIKFLVLPKHITDIGATRQFILEHAPSRYIVMMDDDLSFTKRSGEKRKAKIGFYFPLVSFDKKGQDFNQMVHDLLLKMKKESLAHVAISAREGNNRVTADWAYNQRYMRLYMYDLKIVKDYRYRVTCCEDFDMALQLITTGHSSAICYKYAQGQKASNMKGGMSVYRDVAYHNNAMKKLNSLYPRFVKLREKSTKTAWGGATRIDAMIYWKKALGTFKLIGAESPSAKHIHPN